MRPLLAVSLVLHSCTTQQPATNKELPTVTLPHEGIFLLDSHHRHADTRRFSLTEYSSVSIISTATWGGAYGCNQAKMAMELLDEEGHMKGVQIFRINGTKEDGNSWQHVDPGKYYIDISLLQPVNRCRLTGTYRITQ